MANADRAAGTYAIQDDRAYAVWMENVGALVRYASEAVVPMWEAAWPATPTWWALPARDVPTP